MATPIFWQNGDLHAPSEKVTAVTKHDTNELPYIAKGIYVGGTGDVNLVTISGDTVLFSGVPAGTTLRVVCKQVKSTSTTATLMLALH